MQKHNIQMVDLITQYKRLETDIDAAIYDVVNNGKYINGPQVKDFSGMLSRYLDVPYVVPCGNGTDALQAALMALGLAPGDEVITATFSFVSTVEVIALLGLKPVLVDVDSETFNIDPDLVREALTDRTRAIIPVHLFGQAAAMDEIMDIATKHGLYVIEDAAQSLGATFRMNSTGSEKKTGTIGQIGCTSFFPSKNLGCFGDGGACFTSDKELAEKMRMIVSHGSRRKYHNERIGINSRLDTIQAALLIEKLKQLDDFLQRRRHAAALYYEELSDISFLYLPVDDSCGGHSYNQFTVRVKDGRRDALKTFLADAGIPSMVYYPVPLHHQPVFREYCPPRFSLPVAEMLCEQVLSLPMHTELTSEEIMYITEKIKHFHE
jgi:UDP-2-acetamido-2-deoxy-ribo-hexuluronate aminotransferase